MAQTSSESNSETRVHEGVANLVKNCVAVEPGESVLLLNEHGGVDRDLVALMEDAIREAGGTPYSLWVESLARTAKMPAVVGGAVLAADKLLLNANLNRVVLLDHLRAHGQAELIRINNRSRAADAFASDHSLFDWRLVMELASRIQAVTSAASSWKITSPHGTDIAGRVASGSEVADAFFAQDAEAGRTERVFPGEVYAPVGAVDASGIIAFDHPGFADKERFLNPMMLTVKAGMLTNIEWREEPARPGQREDPAGSTVWTRSQLEGLLRSNEENFGHDRAYAVDSWHGGMHPRALKKGGQQSNANTMHFHIGNVPSARSAYVSDQTITLDGAPFWVDGRSAVLDDPDVRAIAAEFGETLS